eukprot:5661425-Pyramimonas_sp.AAC.1
MVNPGPSSLLALGAPKLLPNPSHEVRLDSAGPQHPTELPTLWVPHINVQLIQQPLLVLVGFRIGSGT